VGVQFEKLGVRELIDLLAASGGSFSESMVNAVENVHQRRDSYLSFRNRLEGIREALTLGKEKIERALKQGELDRNKEEEYKKYWEYAQKYGSIPVSTVNGLIWRLDRLHRSGLFNRNIESITSGLESGKLVVIQGPIWLLGVFATYVLGHVYRKRREYRDAQLRRESAEYFPPFLIVTDEAHNFAPKGFDSPAKSIIREISQEGRKYGAFLVLATQRPTLLDETVTAQLNTKFVFRTVRGTDIATIREETDLQPEESRRLPYLRSGDTFVSSAIFGRTLSVRIRAAKTTSPHTENPFDELKTNRQQKENEFFELIKDKLPIMEANVLEVFTLLRTQAGVEFSLDSVEQLLEQLNKLAEQGRLEKQDSPFGAVYR
jgi:DNA helicase HerA-like ATPase